MNKEKEIMAFLEERVFHPILISTNASQEVKSGIRLTKARMEKLPASSMIKFFWAAIVGTDKSISFAKRMKAEHFIRFEDVLEDFRAKFTDEWLRK